MRVSRGRRESGGLKAEPRGLWGRGAAQGRRSSLGEGPGQAGQGRLGPCQVRWRHRPPPEPAAAETGPEESVWMWARKSRSGLARNGGRCVIRW